MPSEGGPVKKPASLRQAVTAAIPTLANDPDKLLVFVDKGRAVSTGAPGKSFQYGYTLNLILTDWSGDPDHLLFAILEWCRVNESDLLENPEKQARGVRFEVDVLNHETYDVSVELELSERVIVSIDAGGQPTFSHPAEPVPEWTRLGGLI
nr:phage tail protein [Pseudoduganella dura]